jgi:hypothetical protein
MSNIFSIFIYPLALEEERRKLQPSQYSTCTISQYDNSKKCGAQRLVRKNAIEKQAKCIG